MKVAKYLVILTIFMLIGCTTTQIMPEQICITRADGTEVCFPAEDCRVTADNEVICGEFPEDGEKQPVDGSDGNDESDNDDGGIPEDANDEDNPADENGDKDPGDEDFPDAGDSNRDEDQPQEICVTDPSTEEIVCFSPDECIIDDHGYLICGNGEHTDMFFETYYKSCVTLCNQCVLWTDMCEFAIEFDKYICVWEYWNRGIRNSDCNAYVQDIDGWIENSNCTSWQGNDRCYLNIR